MSSIYSGLSGEELYNLYWGKGLSTRKIACIFGISQKPVINGMKYYGIPRRERIDAVVKGCKKYDKKPFSGDLKEKSYILGLALADFRRRMHGKQIDVSTATTHPSLSEIFKEIFSKYTHILERPCYNKTTGKYGWSLECQLHPSFDFLLSDKIVPDWIKDKDDYFLNFLAGYTDGEGTISICKNSSRCVAFILRIASEDREILASIYEWMVKAHFRPTLVKIRYLLTHGMS